MLILAQVLFFLALILVLVVFVLLILAIQEGDEVVGKVLPLLTFPFILFIAAAVAKYLSS